GGVAGALGVAAVRDDLGVQLVRGVADGTELVEAPDLDLGALHGRDQAGDHDLDPVDPVLDLAAHLLDHHVAVVHDGRVAGGALVGDHPPGRAAEHGHQGLSPGAHPGAFDDAGVDRVPQLDPDGPQAVGVE